METHPIRVKEMEAAVAPIQVLHGDAVPVILLVLIASSSAKFRIASSIPSLRLIQAHPAAKCNTGKRLVDKAVQCFNHQKDGGAANERI